jgi:hypothetical protein
MNGHMTEDEMHQNLAQFCDACPERTKEHGDCVDAGEPIALLRCPRVLRAIGKQQSKKDG